MTEPKGPTDSPPSEGGAELPPAFHVQPDHDVPEPPRRVPLPVTLTRSATTFTSDQTLWSVLRFSADALSFDRYARFIYDVLRDHGAGRDPYPNPMPGSVAESPREPRAGNAVGREVVQRLAPWRTGVVPGTDAYRLLRVASEAFMITHCGVNLEDWSFEDLGEARLFDEAARMGGAFPPRVLDAVWQSYLTKIHGKKTLPYLALIRAKLAEVPVVPVPPPDANTLECYGILQQKLTRPCFIELIWSYWHEEGLLVQTMNAISLRFQNKRRGQGRDPLANLELDPLRRLNNLLWGYIQDEQHRLTIARRAHEYAHEYGLTLAGKAVDSQGDADVRSRFLEAFHGLLGWCAAFFAQDDNTTVIADGFPVLNALKDVHLVLAEGAQNQFGDLPWTARQEMLMQQWLLSQPEFREFLPSRTMVANAEPWMDRVDAMKSLQGWSNANITHFHDLARFGELLLLSIRFGNWNVTRDPVRAANWARYFRPELQGYMHAYRTVTGVDLVTGGDQRFVPPSVHLVQRLVEQGGFVLEGRKVR